jgi:hypothetical protein
LLFDDDEEEDLFLGLWPVELLLLLDDEEDDDDFLSLSFLTRFGSLLLDLLLLPLMLPEADLSADMLGLPELDCLGVGLECFGLTAECFGLP